MKQAKRLPERLKNSKSRWVKKRIDTNRAYIAEKLIRLAGVFLALFIMLHCQSKDQTNPQIGKEQERKFLSPPVTLQYSPKNSFLDKEELERLDRLLNK